MVGAAILCTCGGRGWGNQAGRVGSQGGATAPYEAQHLAVPGSSLTPDSTGIVRLDGSGV
jgi:hypothetical protein